MHLDICKNIHPDIHLNSTEYYLPYFRKVAKFCYWFPNAYPHDLVKPLNIEKKYDLGFCGNLIADRNQLLHSIGIVQPKIDSFVIGEKMVEAINSYKIHFNKNISNDINYRTFETLGCKSFLLTNYTQGLEKLFDIGKDLVIYNDISDLRDKIQYFLKNEKEREEIAMHGYNTVIKKHTYDERCKYLLRIIAGTR
jgi:spore maturation protein CgeB